MQYKKRIIEKYPDAAQGFGGHITLSDGTVRMACSLGDIAATSFFPAKPLGCYGDGGAIFTDDDNIASICRSIAVHGKDMQHPDDPNTKYNNARLGMNSRLDTLGHTLQARYPDYAKRWGSGYFGQTADIPSCACDGLGKSAV